MREQLIARPSFMPRSYNSSFSRMNIFHPDPGMVAILEEDGEEGDTIDTSALLYAGEGNNIVNTATLSLPSVSLDVVGWKPLGHRDALIFLPGFSSPLKRSLESFGQLLAMTKLDSRVYPFLFAWPAGQLLTYHSASRVSHSERNYRNFGELMKGLQNAGIRNVHLMSHSMGAQTLVGSFCDKPDGSRSEVSQYFQLASDCDEGSAGTNGTAVVDNTNKNLLVCKTLTMLNPDYPLEPFRKHAFRSIRRICRTITIVGDKKDVALYASQLLNGLPIRFGYIPSPDSPALMPVDDNKDSLGYRYVIGKSVDSLYFPEDVVEKENIKKHRYLLFKEKTPLQLVSKEGVEMDKAWMDLDIIDTTGLDTNVADVRHSAYNLNPSLLRDLEDLVTTERRAMHRSLLHREGNIFSYCSAPAFVNM
jgi:hypothetical protein